MEMVYDRSSFIITLTFLSLKIVPIFIGFCSSKNVRSLKRTFSYEAFYFSIF